MTNVQAIIVIKVAIFLLDVHAHIYGSMSILCYDDLHVESLDISNDSMACDL